MSRDDVGTRRRGPPPSSREHSPREQEEEEWYGDVVDSDGDQQDGNDGGFSGFTVKRPQMHHADQTEGEQWERYFDKQYHSKSAAKRKTIEKGWQERSENFSISSLFEGYKILNLGIQSLMFATPLIFLSLCLILGGNSAQNSVEGSTGLLINLILFILALCLSTISLIQILVHAVNQSLHNRSLLSDGQDVPLLGWSGTFKLSCTLFMEMLLTFVLVWSIEIIGLFLLAEGVPDLSIPAMDSDNINTGSILYLLGLAGSLVASIGVLPYTIQATMERS